MSRLERVADELGDVAASRKELAEAMSGLDEEWNSIWAASGVEAGRPVEMRSWVGRLRSLRESVLGLRRERREWQTLRETRDRARDEIEREVRALGGSWNVATTRRDRIEDAIRCGDDLENTFDALRRAALRNAEEAESAVKAFEDADSTSRNHQDALDAVAEEFFRSVDGLGLTEGPRPREVQARLDQVAALLSHVRERDRLAERIEKMRSNAARFACDVEELVERCMPALAGLAPDTAVIRLREELAIAFERESMRRSLEASIADVRAEHDAANRDLAHLEEAIAGLCREAGVEAMGDLDAVLSASKTFVESRKVLETEESNLAAMGQGRSIEDLEDEASNIDADTLPGRIERLE